MTDSKSETTVIIGGNGKTGRRVAQRLEAMGRPARPVSRSSEVRFDWHDPATWAPALRGASSMYLTYYPDLSVPGAAERVDGVCRVAVDEGLERVVLLAGRGEPQVAPAEDAVRASGLAHTILECAFFSQNFSEGVALPVDGVIPFPAGDTPEPFVDCDDIADVAVAALTEPGHDGAVYELTGPRALTFDEACAEMSKAAGRTITYQPVTFAQYGEMLAPHFEPEEIRFLLELFEFLMDGHNAHPTDGVQRALGRPATDFGAYARGAAEAWR